MRKLLIVFVFLLMAVPSLWAQNQPNILVVWGINGTSSVFAISEKPVVSFTDANLVIISNEVEVTYPLDNLSKITYDYDESMIVYDMQTDEKIFAIKGNILIFPSLKANSHVVIFSVNGKLFFQKTTTQIGTFSYDICNLPKGIYLICVNDLSYKILVK